MILYIVVTAVTILLSYFVCQKQALTTYGTTRRQALSWVCLIAVFNILFLLSALRGEVGNDYKTYAITCHEVWVNGYVVTEPGFNLLVKLVYTILGHENYIAVFAIFAFATVAVFLKTFYKDSDSFFLSMFLFMTLGIYFRTFNTVRYYLILAVALFSIRYVAQKQHVKFVLLIVAASFFHKSVLVVVPLYLIAFYLKKKWQYAIVLIGSLAVFLGKDFIMWIALKLYPSYENTSYLNGEGGILNNLPSIGRCVLVLILCLCFYKDAIKGNNRNHICFNLNIMAVLLYVCGYYLPLLSRFSYYLMVPHVLLVPGVIMRISDEKKKKLVTAVTIGIGILYFLYFLRIASSEGIRVLPYRTWIIDGMKEYIYANEIL